MEERQTSRLGGSRPRYSSPLRQERAADTRARITASAGKLFAGKGFAGTTVAAIAELAGVSVQTVYATFGSKGAIMRALLAQLEADADAESWRLRIEEVTDATQLLAAFAGWTRVLFATSKPTIAAAHGAAGDPAMIELRTQGDQHRREAIGKIVARLDRYGALRSGLSQTRAVDRAWLLTGIDLYLASTDSCGWSDSDYQEWLAVALSQQLLDQPAASPDGST
jgi:AcrR family transcriptional regulator